VALTEMDEPAAEGAVTERASPRKRSRVRRWAFLGVIPFFAYISLFLLIPTGQLIVDAFKGPTGSFTLANVSAILHQPYIPAFEFSLEVSGLCALCGGIFGFLVANAVLHHGVPRFLRPAFVSFSGVAANFAGVPLAFAFLATVGPVGVITDLLARMGLHIDGTFNLQGLFGLSLVYLYFQFPLMILLVMPALEGLKKEWKEAASNLGSSSYQFWRLVGLPVLTPSLLGMMVLLFGNAFSAYATAETLGSTNLVTIWIGELVDGNVSVDPQLAYALAFGMIVIIAVTMVIYLLLQRRASRWLR
jgi:putative spermidine/putrescine transport system permease protein